MNNPVALLLLSAVSAYATADESPPPPAHPPPSSPSPPSSPPVDGLAAGAIVGIVIGVLAFVGALGAAAWYFLFMQGAKYAHLVGGPKPTGAPASRARAMGDNNLPMMAMKVSGDDAI